MVTHSRIRAWRIPWTEEPGELQSTGSRREIGTSLALQWLRLGLLMQGVWFNPCSGSLDPSCLMAKKPKHETEAILQQIQQRL